MLESSFRVAIVGAGITGLAAAYKLMELSGAVGNGRENEKSEQGGELKQGNGLKLGISIFESSRRVGGVIQTLDRDGYVMELGPDSIFTAKKAAVLLCSKLGIENQLIATDEANRRSLLALNGKLYPLPDGFVMLAPSKIGPFMTSPLFSFAGKMRMVLDLVQPPREDGEDETVESFITRRFGREALEKVAQPMVGGIYVGDVSELSASATLETFVEMERKYGSVIKGLMARKNVSPAADRNYSPEETDGNDKLSSAGARGLPERHFVPSSTDDTERLMESHSDGETGTPCREDLSRSRADAATFPKRTTSGARYSMFLSLSGGLGTLIDSLEKALAVPSQSLTVKIEKGKSVRNLSRDEHGRWCLLVHDETTDDENQFQFDAVIFAIPAPKAGTIVRSIDEQIAGKLSSIEFASSAVVNFLYKREAISRPLDAFGFVVPKSERRSILAASFASTKYTGRAPLNHVVIRTFQGGVLQADLLENSNEELMDLARRDLEHYLGISARPEQSFLTRWLASMPQYNLGHLKRVFELEQYVERNMPGIYFAGNSYRGVGIPDCILSGEKAATMAFDYGKTFSYQGPVTA